MPVPDTMWRRSEPAHINKIPVFVTEHPPLPSANPREAAQGMEWITAIYRAAFPRFY